MLETTGRHGPDRTGGRQTLDESAAGWLAGRRLAPSTRRLYDHLLARWISPTFGSTPHRSIKAADVRVGFVETHEQIPSGSAKCYRLLRAMLTAAVRDGHIAQNPPTSRGGREEAPERPVLDVDEAFAHAAHPRVRALILTTAFRPALRLGECLGLRRRDLDLSRHTLSVVGQLDQYGAWRSPKTAAGTRTTVWPRAIIEVLELHLAAYPPTDLDGPLFTGREAVG